MTNVHFTEQNSKAGAAVTNEYCTDGDPAFVGRLKTASSQATPAAPARVTL